MKNKVRVFDEVTNWALLFIHTAQPLIVGHKTALLITCQCEKCLTITFHLPAASRHTAALFQTDSACQTTRWDKHSSGCENTSKCLATSIITGFSIFASVHVAHQTNLTQESIKQAWLRNPHCVGHCIRPSEATKPVQLGYWATSSKLTWNLMPLVF